MDRQKMNDAIAGSRNALEDIYRAGYIAGREENKIKMTNYEMLKEKDKVDFAYWLANINIGCEYNPFCPACKLEKSSRRGCKGGYNEDDCVELWIKWLMEGVNNVSEETE